MDPMTFGIFFHSSPQRQVNCVLKNGSGISQNSLGNPRKFWNSPEQFWEIPEPLWEIPEPFFHFDFQTKTGLLPNSSVGPFFWFCVIYSSVFRWFDYSLLIHMNRLLLNGSGIFQNGYIETDPTDHAEYC